MFGKMIVESPEQIGEHLAPVDKLKFLGSNDGMQLVSGSLWTFPDLLHREKRFFRLEKSLKGPVQHLRAGARHEVEDESFLRPNDDKTHFVSVGVDAYHFGKARVHTSYAVESNTQDGYYLGDEQFKEVAARGIWEYLSGIRQATDNRAVEEFESSQHTAEDRVLKYFKAIELRYNQQLYDR